MIGPLPRMAFNKESVRAFLSVCRCEARVSHRKEHPGVTPGMTITPLDEPRHEGAWGSTPFDPAVYRIYDREGRLLYVGAARAVRGRLLQHLREGHFETGAEVSIQFVATFAELARVEARAIATERPLLNQIPGRTHGAWREREATT